MIMILKTMTLMITIITIFCFPVPEQVKTSSIICFQSFHFSPVLRKSDIFVDLHEDPLFRFLS